MAENTGPVTEREAYVHFLSNVGSRLSAEWFVESRITQLVMGHDAFMERLYRLGLSVAPRCNCLLGGPETPERVLYECTK